MLKSIVAELRCVYKEDALALATVKKWCKRFVEGKTSLCDDPRSGRPLSNDLAEAIASILREKPFASCKVLCRHFRIAQTTCLRILHDNLGMKRFNLRWVPHALNSNQKAERVTLSHEILAILESDRRNSFRNVIIGDESWFLVYYPRDSIWAQSRDEVPERIRQKIDSEKCLISVLWSVNGIHSLEEVPKGTAYDSALVCDITVPRLVQGLCSDSARRSLKGCCIHLENARPHNSKRSAEWPRTTNIKRLSQPSHSPDIAPSDFSLFGYLKEKLTEYDIPDRERRKLAITHIFSETGQETLITNFEPWIKRRKWVTKHEGEYFH
jgi:transposase